ncbi:hypothetical protein AB6T38_11020 [Aliiglaciecola sp. SL4]|uniref:hypothetical protein n=1 Tax=Aliiglaciecola sp. SL4 TaxID=3239806 RepID=UPI00355C723F
MKLVDVENKSEYHRLVVGLSPLESFVQSKELVDKYVEGYDSDILAPKWLLSNYQDTVWSIKLDSATVKIDFDVVFVNSKGGLEKLLSPAHYKLLNTFKCWLLIQSSSLHSGFQKLSHATISKKIRNTLYLIDYLLLNSDKFHLEKHFSNWNSDYVYSMLADLFDKDKITVGVYNTEERLASYIEQNSSSYTDQKLDEHFEKLSKKFTLDDTTVGNKKQSREITFLMLQGAFDFKKGSNRYGNISASFLRNRLYSNTLYGHRVQLPRPKAYQITELTSYNQTSEFKQHPLSKRSEVGISHAYFRTIRQNFFLLSDIPYVAEHSGLEVVEISSRLFGEINLETLMAKPAKRAGRTITIGAGEILIQIKNAFEFIYDNREVLFDSIERVLDAGAKEIEETSLLEFINFGYKKYLSPEVIQLGVEVIGYASTEKDRYKKRRENKDLFFLFNVLQGSLQIIVGATMARRMGELVDLHPLNAITPSDVDPDESKDQEFNLIFDNRKSGVAYGGEILREELSRPILNSLASLIYKWQTFNAKINELRLVEHLDNMGLFNSLSFQTLTFKEGNSESFVDNLDAFCDYFETRTYVDEYGMTRRLYIRQHQLRRFFAMTFYWSYGYEAGETLRYFLAHTDISHLERYIKEEMTGEELRGVQAERLIDGIKNDDITKIGELEIILKNRFGINSLEFRTYEEISEDVEDEIISLSPAHKHVIPQRYSGYEALLVSIEQMLVDGVIDLKADYAVVTNDNGSKAEVMDLVLKYE